MWQQYKRSFIATQAFILVACAIVRFLQGAPWFVIGVVFLVMQVAAIPGAWFSARINHKMIARNDALPLDKRLP